MKRPKSKRSRMLIVKRWIEVITLFLFAPFVGVLALFTPFSFLDMGVGPDMIISGILFVLLCVMGLARLGHPLDE